MKDVDPNGFMERRPKWKPGTIAGLPDASGQAPPPLPDPSASYNSSQRQVHVMDQSIDKPLRMEAQPVSRSLPYSNTHPVLDAQLLGINMFQPEGFTAGKPSLSTDVPHDVGRGAMGNGVGEDWNMDDSSAQLLNSGVPRTAGSIVTDTHGRDEIVTTHSSLTALQEFSPHSDYRGDAQAQHPQSESGNIGMTSIVSGNSTVVMVPNQSGPNTNQVSVGAPDASENPCKPLIARSDF